MSTELRTFFSEMHKEKNLTDDKDPYGITSLSNIGHITSYSLGLLSIGVGIYTVYSLRKKKIEMLTDYRMLGFLVGFILLKIANSFRYYDQKSYINNYHREITKRVCALTSIVEEGKLEGFPEEVVENEWRKIFDSLEAFHGWSNLIYYKILCNNELHRILLMTLKNYPYPVAAQKYRMICSRAKLAEKRTFLPTLWKQMEAKKTILDLLEEDVPVDLSAIRAEWNTALGEHKTEYLAYRKVIRDQIAAFQEKKRVALQDLYASLKYDRGEYVYQVINEDALEDYNSALNEAQDALDRAIKLESERHLKFDKEALRERLRQLRVRYSEDLQEVKHF